MASERQGDDIYKELPKGTNLSKELLRKADQIVRVESEIILVYNISKDVEYYDPHLLFFNAELKLYSATYFASQKIESIKNGQISAYLNEYRNGRIGAFRNDIPKNYTLNLIPEKAGRRGRMENKIIDKISINEGLSLSLAIRASESIYSFPSQAEKNNLNLVDDFPIKDTLNFQLIDLNFNYKARKITSKTTGKRGEVWDNMVVIEKEIIDNFYDELFKKIKTLHNTSYSK